MATDRQIAKADNASRLGSGPGNEIVGDPGVAYPPTGDEGREVGKRIALYAFRGHECDLYLYLPEGRYECVVPGHDECLAVGRELLGYLFGKPGPIRNSHH